MKKRTAMDQYKFQVTHTQLIGLILLAYFFSFAIRMIWVYQFYDMPDFYWNEQLMINTNDGYTWAAGAQKILEHLHMDNPRIPDMWKYGTVFFTVLFTKVTPFSLETVILYMPTIISSMVVIPIILIARLYKQTIWGFFAALLGSITWSYYNRTMTGYYDTDMFSAMAPMFILYFLMKSTMDFNLKSALYAAIAIALYPFLYNAGASIVYAMGIIYAGYLLFYHGKEKNTYHSMILVFFALLHLPLDAPFNYLTTVLLLIGIYLFLQKKDFTQKTLMIASVVLLISFMYFGNVFGLILHKIMSYISTGTEVEGLHFYGVHQTIREAGKIPFEVFANRTSGSSIGVIIALVGYVVLVVRHRAFILALPLIGIGIFALWGGLRFTVYAVPVVAMSAIYLFHVIIQMLTDKKSIYILAMGLLTTMMLYPNITHIISYKVPTVLNKAEVEDLEKLNQIADTKDYTLSWWDYGYPIWYYSDTNTLIDGGKHQNDNYIISKIMQTSSPELAVNLARLAVETYTKGVESYDMYIKDRNEKDISLEFQMHDKDGKLYHAGYKPVSNVIFRNKEKDQKDPNLFLSELENGLSELPQKTRDIYLYLPYRMMSIFPTVSVFGNIDLTTGKAEKEMTFYPSSLVRNQDGMMQFRNGIVFDAKKGEVNIGNKKGKVKNFIVTQNTAQGKIKLQSQMYHIDGKYIVVYMKSYGQFVVMDIETFKSMYVQMFILGKYDKNLFELVVSSPYSKIYKLKR